MVNADETLRGTSLWHSRLVIVCCRSFLSLQSGSLLRLAVFFTQFYYTSYHIPLILYVYQDVSLPDH